MSVMKGRVPPLLATVLIVLCIVIVNDYLKKQVSAPPTQETTAGGGGQGALVHKFRQDRHILGSDDAMYGAYQLLAPKIPKETLDFFPPHSYHKCEKLPTTGVAKSAQYQNLMDQFQTEVVKHKVKWQGSASVFGQGDFYYRVAQEDWIQTVCEIGFNSGYSAIAWLSGGPPDRKVYFFDIGTLSWTPPMITFFNKLFPDRFEVIIGDSTKTVWAEVKLFKKCDLVIVDGGHTFDVAMHDVMNIKKLANPKHHLIIMDDTPARQHMTNVVMAWMWGQIEYGVQHLFGCTVDNNDRGFSVGYYRDLVE